MAGCPDMDPQDQKGVHTGPGIVSVSGKIYAQYKGCLAATDVNYLLLARARKQHKS